MANQSSHAQQASATKRLVLPKVQKQTYLSNKTARVDGAHSSHETKNVEIKTQVNFSSFHKNTSSKLGDGKMTDQQQLSKNGFALTSTGGFNLGNQMPARNQNQAGR